MGQVSEWGLYRFFVKMRQEDQRARYLRPKSDPRRVLANDIEREVRAKLEAHGYRVTKTRHNESWDLWCEGVRVEVKGSRWNGRYQANLRGNQADVLILGCVNGDVRFFVIPFDALGECKALAIWSENPQEYMGKWARFLEAWSVVDDLVANPPPNPWQLPLF
jgi:hypothetical protein